MSTSFSLADFGIARTILTFSSNACSSDNNVIASSLGFLVRMRRRCQSSGLRFLLLKGDLKNMMVILRERRLYFLAAHLSEYDLDNTMKDSVYRFAVCISDNRHLNFEISLTT